MSKFFLISFTIFVLVIDANCFGHKPIIENKIANILLKSSPLIEKTPQQSMECFAIYIPKLNDLTKTYELEYETCLQQSKEYRDSLDLEVQKERKHLEESAEKVCDSFNSCSRKIDSTYEFFECFSNAAAESTNTVYNIQNISKDKMEYIKIKNETIEYDQNRCTDKCSRVYVEKSTKIYDDLDKCLAGLVIESPTQIPSVKV
ncbi:hypothetical protein FF38_02386 [Lucilia cuprina]|uniref:Protein TsetseEP domain-containing protein n=1 Tax=Lucilia cuprina TaxID=7375 RepID=A0A0L0CA79_LUCCU|nr:Protein TsetseEP [Lucilia cuprina]KNC29333.1 hypothetical protein FF38_02386 [Lucilia cuprina]